jgi:hypothetical protein
MVTSRRGREYVQERKEGEKRKWREREKKGKEKRKKREEKYEEKINRLIVFINYYS